MTQLLKTRWLINEAFGAGRQRKARHYTVATARGAFIILLLLIFVPPAFTERAAAAQTKLEVGDWVTECDILHETADADCSVIGVFRNTISGGPRGAYSLLVDLRNHQTAIVGQPPPTSATLRVDKNPPLECTGNPYCVFSDVDSSIIEHELATGSIILVDIKTKNGTARASLSTKEYQASFAKLRAEGWSQQQ